MLLCVMHGNKSCQGGSMIIHAWPNTSLTTTPKVCSAAHLLGWSVTLYMHATTLASYYDLFSPFNNVT